MSNPDHPAVRPGRLNLSINTRPLPIMPALLAALLAAAIYLILKTVSNSERPKRSRQPEPTSLAAPAASNPKPPEPEQPVEKEEKEPAGEYVRGWGTIVMIIYLVLLSGWLLYSLIQLWPLTAADGETVMQVRYGWGEVFIPNEMRLLLVVAISGALGGLIHALRSFYWYVGNRILKRSWIPMYLLLPLTGATLGLVFYLVIRGGFFSTQATVDQTSPFGFAALAGLVGMFSQQAVLKLKQVAETLLAKPEPGKDAKPQEESEEAPNIDSQTKS